VNQTAVFQIQHLFIPKNKIRARAGMMVGGINCDGHGTKKKEKNNNRMYIGRARWYRFLYVVLATFIRIP